MTLLDRAIDLLCGAQSGFVSGSMPDVDWQNAKDKLLKDYRESRGVAQAAPEPTPTQVNSACLSYRHDFGMIGAVERERTQFEAREWLRAWQNAVSLANRGGEA